MNNSNSYYQRNIERQKGRKSRQKIVIPIKVVKNKPKNATMTKLVGKKQKNNMKTSLK